MADLRKCPRSISHIDHLRQLEQEARATEAPIPPDPFHEAMKKHYRLLKKLAQLVRLPRGGKRKGERGRKTVSRTAAADPGQVTDRVLEGLATSRPTVEPLAAPVAPPRLPAEVESRVTDPPPAVTVPGKLILGVLLECHPELRSIEAICERLQDQLSERTIGPELNNLIGAGLALRPDGRRKGATLTLPGKDLAERISAIESLPHRPDGPAD